MRKVDLEARAKKIHEDQLASILRRLDRLELVMSKFSSVWTEDAEKVNQYIADWRTRHGKAR